MKAAEANFLGFLKRSPQFAIPIYQRTYSWTERECSQLWDDIRRTGEDDRVPAHFTGSIVYIEKDLYQISQQSSLLVIDGQQRLTTIMLIIEALARRVGCHEPLEGFSAKKLRNYYLLNPLEEGEQRFKLLLTRTDKESLIALMEPRSYQHEQSLRIKANFSFFENRLQDTADTELTTICKGLAKLTIVDVALRRDQDNPQLIFESMNSTGRELSQADLIRNFVLMELEPAHQTRLYDKYWRPMEVSFGQEAYSTHFDGFVRHYLTIRTGDLPNVRAVYESFKKHAGSAEVSNAGVDALVAEIHTFAGYYCAMALDKEQDRELAAAFKDLRELKANVAFPLLLELYHDYAQEVLSKQAMLRTVRLIEAYVFRRAVCAIPTNSLNKTFATFSRSLDKGRYMESIEASFLRLRSYRRFPKDEEFRRELSQRDLYNFPRRSYWLRRLENHERKERVPVDEYTIEHIMPQNKDLSADWQESLGPDWQNVQETRLHTLGNLTLTGYNSEYSDRPFNEKRDMKGGFKESPLRLNGMLGQLDNWNKHTIDERAARLARDATEVWRSPDLPSSVFATLLLNDETSNDLSPEHLSDLVSDSRVMPVFDVFRKAVLALDPSISEEFLDSRVAYKAETNFVDVIPEERQLRLLLNLPLHELHDPRAWATDAPALDRSQIDGTEVRLATVEDVPYATGLVRQAFEKQMDSEMEAG